MSLICSGAYVCSIDFFWHSPYAYIYTGTNAHVNIENGSHIISLVKGNSKEIMWRAWEGELSSWNQDLIAFQEMALFERFSVRIGRSNRRDCSNWSLRLFFLRTLDLKLKSSSLQKFKGIREVSKLKFKDNFFKF